MLLEFQRDFAAFLMRGAPPPVAIDRAPGNAARYGVYRRNFAGNLTGALGGAYPALHRVLGDAMFADLVIGFAATNPPAEADLHRYGEGFALHVSRTAPEPAWLLDLARVDWAATCALHAPDAPAIGPDMLDTGLLANAGARRLVLRPHPSLRLLALGHRVRALRGALLAGDDAAALDASREVSADGENLGVLRGTEGMTVLDLPTASFRLATCLAGGVAVAEVMAGATDAEALGLFLYHGFFSEAEVV